MSAPADRINAGPGFARERSWNHDPKAAAVNPLPSALLVCALAELTITSSGAAGASWSE
jgi:hypothetical protein